MLSSCNNAEVRKFAACSLRVHPSTSVRPITGYVLKAIWCSCICLYSPARTAEEVFEAEMCRLSFLSTAVLGKGSSNTYTSNLHRPSIGVHIQTRTGRPVWDQLFMHRLELEVGLELLKVLSFIDQVQTDVLVQGRGAWWSIEQDTPCHTRLALAATLT